MIKKHQEELNKFCKKHDVALAFLFGSETRGTSHQDSDIDIGVLFDKKVNPKNYLELEGKFIEFFSDIYPQKEINVVNLNIASPLLKQTVVLEGNLLYIRSRTDHILFQIRTLREYEDYLYLSNIYNQFLELRLKSL